MKLGSGVEIGDTGLSVQAEASASTVIADSREKRGMSWFFIVIAAEEGEWEGTKGQDPS
jgi:hypothetical protein